ncbi:MAG: type II toxin-antitoxin system Phd/YefM family antitoxin [Planctomycetes bacterium]|nr:type II toxin-antitoxin system Phd/YefM family antitoxin [Planctomycetota bacterium]
MLQPIDRLTLAEFERSPTELLERLDDTGRALALTVSGRPRAIVLGVQDYERLVELADRAETIESIRRGLEDVKAGRMMTLEEFDRAMRRRFEERGDA